MLKRTRRSPFLYIFQFTFREEGKGGERERERKEKGKVEGEGGRGRKKNESGRKRREEASRLQQRIPDIWPTKKNNLFSASTNSTCKLTYRNSLLLLYLVLEQELWFAGEVEEDEKYVGKYECQRRKHGGT